VPDAVRALPDTPSELYVVALQQNDALIIAVLKQDAGAAVHAAFVSQTTSSKRSS
jgi:hypothetical protein